jgi:hypothetical protein
VHKTQRAQGEGDSSDRIVAKFTRTGDFSIENHTMFL